MYRFCKLISCILAPALVLSIGGCATKAQSGAVTPTAQSTSSTSSVSDSTLVGNFSLPYLTVPDFNPLLPASPQNEALWPLIYDCVSEPGLNYSPVMRLASSVTSSGTTATIQLKSGITFTDGSQLTGSDVAYSYNFVKSHAASPYNALLSNVSSISPQGLTVTLTLKSPDPLIANMLDIPIIKQNTGVTSNAIGSGRYSYKKDGVNASLSLNTKWYGGGASSFSKINLVNIPNSNAVMSSLAIGEINYVYSDSGGGPAPSSVNTETTSVNLNRLIFIGLNTKKPYLNNSHFRRALSFSIDRQQLVSQTYSNRAAAAVLPFNPSLSLLKSPSANDTTSDFTKASSELSLAGSAESLNASSFTLLVNQEDAVRVAAAKYIASCFAKAGINVSVKSVSFADYQNLIKSGNFDMYIGETALANDMDLSSLLAPGTASSFGMPENCGFYTAFKNWQAGTSSIGTAASAFTSEMPFIPLCYRMGTTSYTKGLTGVKAASDDIFYDFQNWSFK